LIRIHTKRDKVEIPKLDLNNTLETSYPALHSGSSIQPKSFLQEPLGPDQTIFKMLRLPEPVTLALNDHNETYPGKRRQADVVRIEHTNRTHLRRRRIPPDRLPLRSV
jgi:hypothetical protein